MLIANTPGISVHGWCTDCSHEGKIMLDLCWEGGKDEDASHGMHLKWQKC